MPTIRSLRRARSMTQPELAEKLGVSVITIKSWERGLRHPKREHVLRLAAFFGVPVETLQVSRYMTAASTPHCPTCGTLLPSGKYAGFESSPRSA